MFEEGGGYLSLPVKVYETEHVRLTFRPLPIREDARGTITRAVGAFSSGDAVWVQGAKPIRRKVRDKANAYGDPGMPYVIAVNATAVSSPEPFDVASALFGREGVRLLPSPDGPASILDPMRENDGAWSPDRNTRVSAVLVTMPVRHGNVPRAPIQVVRNPWAARPIGPTLDRLPQLVATPEEIRLEAGETVGDILDIPENWPGVR